MCSRRDQHSHMHARSLDLMIDHRPQATPGLFRWSPKLADLTAWIQSSTQSAPLLRCPETKHDVQNVTLKHAGRTCCPMAQPSQPHQFAQKVLLAKIGHESWIDSSLKNIIDVMTCRMQAK